MQEMIRFLWRGLLACRARHPLQGCRLGTFAGAGVLMLAVLLSLNCAPKAENNANVPTKQYQLHGEIKGLDAGQHVATIKHDEIPGFMGAMTMGYPVKDTAEFSKLTVGEPITATLYVKGDEFWLANIQRAK